MLESIHLNISKSIRLFMYVYSCVSVCPSGRLIFSLFDRAGNNFIEYEDLVAYAEETGDMSGIRDAAAALEILDKDGDGKIGLLDFIHFARRLKQIHEMGGDTLLEE